MAVTTITRVGARSRVLSPAVALGGLVLLSFAVRVAIAWLRSTPLLLPDEYIYSTLGRSIAEHGQLLIRGHSAHFPAVLAPLLTSPAWLVEDVATAYRIAQAIQALAISLVAVPVFVLARQLRLSPWLAVAVAVPALCLPDVVYASFIVAESFAFPLALAAVAAAVSALERPRRSAQLLFVGLAVLATLTRLQFVVLPVCYAAAALAVGLRERRVRAVAREQALPLGLFALGGLALGVVGIGYYGEIVHLQPSPVDLAHSTATNALVFAYAAGWAIVPAGLIGLALALARPRDRAEFVFAAMAGSVAVAIFAEAAAYGSQTHERYTFYLAPLLALCFALYARRGWPHRLALALVSAVVVTGATLVPLTDLSFRGEQNTVVLVAVHSLRLHMSSTGAAALATLTVAVALVGLAALLSRRPAVATGFALVASAATGLAAYGLAVDFDLKDSQAVEQTFLPANRSWVDAQRLAGVSLLQAAGGKQTDALIQLFWNRSIDRFVTLPGGGPVDAFHVDPASVSAAGTLRVGGRPLDGALLVDNAGSTLELVGARKVASSPNYDLWVPTRSAPPRLRLYYAGRYRDGWVGPSGRIDVWSPGPGLVRIPLRLPRSLESNQVRVTLPGGAVRAFTLRPGSARVLELPVCSAGAWHATLNAGVRAYVGPRPVSARSGLPSFVPGPAECGPASAPMRAGPASALPQA
jgi:hypothetical protein